MRWPPKPMAAIHVTSLSPRKRPAEPPLIAVKEQAAKIADRLEARRDRLREPGRRDDRGVENERFVGTESSGDTEVEDKSVLDAAIVASAQAVEHYEIARYGTLIAWAEELGHDDIVRFLNTNLNEEKAANTKLNTVALRKGVNRRAAS